MKFKVQEIVSRKGEVHFRRYRFLELPWFRIYLHQILKADKDGDEHDHPWSFMSLILWGGYIEQSYGQFSTKRIGNFVISNSFRSHLLYRILSPTWSLVIAWGKRKPWGYHTKFGWKDNITYRKDKHWKAFEENNGKSD